MSKLKISVIVTIVYALITLIGVLNHEVWADEAQVWQLCKYLSLPELFNHLHNEGHPAFFYLLVMPFAKMFSDIIYMQLICWAFMCVSVFLLFYFAPFKLYTKFAITLSAGFFYFLPVIARSYSILPALVFLAAILYSKQKEHPVLYALVLAAIANTHAIMFAFSFILFCLFVYDNFIKNQDKNFKKYIFPAVIFVLGFCAVIWQLHDTAGSNTFINMSFSGLLKKALKVIFLFFINGYNKLITDNVKLNIPIIDIICILSSMIIYVTLFVALYKNYKRLFYIVLFSLGFQFCIYIFAYSSYTYVTRIFTAHIILLFCLWILLEKNNVVLKNIKNINILIALFFILTFSNGIIYYYMDLKHNYAGAKEASIFIQDNIHHDDILLFDNEPLLISLAYYLKENYQLFSVIRNRYFKYIIWDYLSKSVLDNRQWDEYVRNVKKDNNARIFLIKTENEEKLAGMFGELNKNLFIEIFHSSPVIKKGEELIIYEYIGN